VHAGIAAAQGAGPEVKINTVALAHDNAAELPELIRWSHGEGMDLTLIETMPMGEVEADRSDQFLSLGDVRRELAGYWTLTDLPLSTGGPAALCERGRDRRPARLHHPAQPTISARPAIACG